MINRFWQCRDRHTAAAHLLYDYSFHLASIYYCLLYLLGWNLVRETQMEYTRTLQRHIARDRDILQSICRCS